MQLANSHVFECHGCGAVHNTADPRFPIGWSKQGGTAWCNDCTAAGIPARQIAQARRSGRRAA